MSLPDADKLRLLPLRAVVAYAFRSGSRMAEVLDGLHPEAHPSEVLECARRFVTERDIGERDNIEALRAAERMSKFSTTQPGTSLSAHIASALVEVALATHSAISAAEKPSEASLNMKRTAERAERTAKRAATLADVEPNVVTDAGSREYQVLLQKFGESDEIVIGEPFDMSAVFGD